MHKKDFYENRALRYNNFDKQGYIRYERACNLMEISPDSAILDVGCKKAHLLDILESRKIDCNYTGIDISKAVIDNLKEKNGTFIIHDLMESLPFSGNSFDNIFCLEVLEHLENPTFALKQFHKVLKSDGALFLSIPNVYNWLRFIGNIAGIKDREGHIHSFTFQDMNTILEFTGFKIDAKCGTYGIIPFTPHGIKNNNYFMFKTNILFLTTSYIYKIKKL